MQGRAKRQVKYVNIKENTGYQVELQQRKSRKGGAMLPADSGVSYDSMQ